MVLQITTEEFLSVFLRSIFIIPIKLKSFTFNLSCKYILFKIIFILWISVCISYLPHDVPQGLDFVVSGGPKLFDEGECEHILTWKGHLLCYIQIIFACFFPLSHSSVQPIFSVCLLCNRLWFRHWNYIREQNRQNYLSMEGIF